MIRRAPNLSERCASALLDLQVLRGAPIDREMAKAMTAGEIIALFHADHDGEYACHGADNHPAKLTMRLIADHQRKTAKVDIPAIAKGKRLSETQREFCNKLLRKIGQGLDAEAARRKRGRRLPCGKQSGWKKPMGKNAIRRTTP